VLFESQRDLLDCLFGELNLLHQVLDWHVEVLECPFVSAGADGFIVYQALHRGGLGAFVLEGVEAVETC
jgi:hypothetical protein